MVNHLTENSQLFLIVLKSHKKLKVGNCFKKKISRSKTLKN